MPHFRINTNLLNQPIKCFFDILGSCSSIGPTGTSNWSFNGACWFSSFLLSSKGFILKSLATSKRERSETLNVALMLYLLGRSNLYALSLILARTWNGPSPLGCSLDCLWGGKSFLSHMHPNPITRFKDDLSTAHVGFGCILLIFLFYVLPYTFM